MDLQIYNSMEESSNVLHLIIQTTCFVFYLLVLFADSSALLAGWFACAGPDFGWNERSEFLIEFQLKRH
jgi:hypothetical protein